MAKQAGPVFIEGTIDDLTFYKMEGKYYVRLKSSLTGRKFRKHKAFERSRESCKRFSEGNRLASRLYRMVEEEKRTYKLFCFLKRKAIQFLKEGRSLTEAEERLMDELGSFGLIESTIPLAENHTLSEGSYTPEKNSHGVNAKKNYKSDECSNKEWKAEKHPDLNNKCILTGMNKKFSAESG